MNDLRNITFPLLEMKISQISCYTVIRYMTTNKSNSFNARNTIYQRFIKIWWASFYSVPNYSWLLARLKFDSLSHFNTQDVRYIIRFFTKCLISARKYCKQYISKHELRGIELLRTTSFGRGLLQGIFLKFWVWQKLHDVKYVLFYYNVSIDITAELL